MEVVPTISQIVVFSMAAENGTSRSDRTEHRLLRSLYVITFTAAIHLIGLFSFGAGRRSAEYPDSSVQ